MALSRQMLRFGARLVSRDQKSRRESRKVARRLTGEDRRRARAG